MLIDIIILGALVVGGVVGSLLYSIDQTLVQIYGRLDRIGDTLDRIEKQLGRN